tara:strand:- start:8548 stop:8739 length:192 start_codon:yes stop_codon:yes gene_type:complete
VTFATSDRGQFTFEMLAYVGITPQQWRDLDQRDATFIQMAFAEKNKRLNNQQRRQQNKAKHGR